MNLNSSPMDEMGRFAGYASVFNQVDQGGDIVMPGAFKKSLMQKNNQDIRLLFQHDPKEPIGIWEQVQEDGFGLWVRGRLLPGIERADALKKLIIGGALDGLSIGFKTQRAKKDRVTGFRHLYQVKLWEISIVTFPMMEGARIKPSATNQERNVSLARSLDAAISLLRNQ